MKTHFKTSKLCLAALTAVTLAFGNSGTYSVSYANPRSQDPISCSDPKTQFPTLPPCHRSNGLGDSANHVEAAQSQGSYIRSVSTQLNFVARNDGTP
ncbi:MAG: hypothetical protein ACK456_01745 [Pseudanabaenaceae cyanobacterium]|jgi:hypothetical protein